MVQHMEADMEGVQDDLPDYTIPSSNKFGHCCMPDPSGCPSDKDARHSKVDRQN